MLVTQAFGNIAFGSLWIEEWVEKFLAPCIGVLILVGLLMVALAGVLMYISDLHTLMRLKTEDFKIIIDQVREGVIILNGS